MTNTTTQKAANATHDSGAPSTPEEILSSVFGYSDFRGEQKRIIEGVISVENCLVLMPTGSGKSLCYQIPALCRPGVGVVVSPLIALMQDQVMGLKELGVKAAAIHSALTYPLMRATLEDLEKGRLDLVYVAPERLASDEFLGILDKIDLALFAIDEAHCISQWGHDFRPEYRQLSILRERYRGIPCVAVTATADAPTRKDIMDRLSLEKLYSGGFDRPNILYEVAIKDNPRAQFLRFLKSRKASESGIVYCLSRRKVEETARWLRERGYRALPYHASLPAETRAQNQDMFLKEEGVIVVATIAFGMGINKPDVRFVAHLDLPKNIEAYYQETGRAGRDGLPSVAWMVYGPQDVTMQRQMIENGGSPEDQKRTSRNKLDALLGYCETTTCRRQVLLQYFGDWRDPCGHCDTCLTPPITIDGTVPAQKILSCIHRTGQMFGAAHIIDVLLGADTEKIRKFRHKDVSTYGIGADHTRKEWQSLIRQLVAGSFLAVDMEEYGGLKITPQGVTFLKDKQRIALRLDPKTTGSSSRRAQKPDPAIAPVTREDKVLFAALKALRLSIAKENDIPPYMVFHDKTLMDMAAKKPKNLEEMSLVHGVGQSKLQKYGAVFLERI